MIDFNKYVGIPWVCGKSEASGADCWGIVCMVYKELFKIELDHFKPSTIDSTTLTSNKIEFVRDNSKNWRRVESPLVGDVVMMISRATLRPEHVGVYVGCNNVLHSLTRDHGQSEIHKIKLLNKLFKRLEFYRYAS